MRELWHRLAAAAAGTPLPLRLRPPASEAAIAAAERTMGLAFPTDFRESLRVHDGQEQTDEDDTFEWLPGQARLAPLDEIIAHWRDSCACFERFHAGEPPEEIDGGRLYHYLWHARRIPIAGNRWWDQDNTYLDLLPGPAGVAGQLAIFGKGVFGAVQAPGFRVALELYANALESGEWLFRAGRCVSRRKRPVRWARYVEQVLARHQR